MHILIADHSREIRSALRLALAELYDQTPGDGNPAGPPSERWEVLDAGDEAEALAHAAEHSLSAALVDWELPGLNPADLLQEIRTRSPECTIIGMSGRPEDRERSLQAGVDYFVCKNEPPAKLLDLLREL